MKKMTAGWACAALLLVASGCGDSHDAVMADSFAASKEMATILKGIQDEASAKAAGPQIAALGRKMEQIKKRQDALGKPTQEQVDAMAKKYKKQVEDVMASMMPDMMRVGTNPQWVQHLQEPLKKFGAAMKQAGGPEAEGK